MPQVSLYLNAQTMNVLKKETAGKKGSVSGFIANLIMNRQEEKGWPVDYWNDVYGCLDDDSFRVPEEIDETFDGALPTFS